MALNLPAGAKLKTSAKIYYGKYPFKVHFQAIKPANSRHHWDWASKECYRVMTNINEKLDKDFIKRNRPAMHAGWSTFISYFTNEADLNAYLASYEFKQDCHKIEVYQLTEEQQDTLKLDAKIVIRDQLYYDKFQYKLAFKAIDSDTLDSILAQFLTEDEIEDFTNISNKDERTYWRRQLDDKRFCKTASNDRVRLAFGSSASYSTTNLYFKDDEDVAMARLMVTSSAKLFKVMKA